jgi:aspartyl-tRNA(Asn)/glutamyl-tRNA(Gln) amidotransferase subunit C
VALQLTPEDVARIAELARLELEPDEAPALARQLTTILEYAAQIQQVDTSTMPAAAPRTAVWREDDIRPGVARDDALEQAPDAHKSSGLFRVPKVL